MAAGTLDAFLLYNERESSVEVVANALEKRGLSTHFWKRDVSLGDHINELEQGQLAHARVVLVLLGDAGWGKIHRRITEEARAQNKRIIPVLVGTPPDAALDEAGGLFRDYRYADLRKLDEASFDELAASISVSISVPNWNGTGRFDAIVRVLTDGNEDERSLLLNRIANFETIDRAALASRLRSEIQQRFNPGSEARFAPAVRDPKRTSSVRSWMLSALIWADAEGAESRPLILQHLAMSYEPDRSVRFWALAGLYSSGASYVQEAASSSVEDSEIEVSGLARTIQRPNDDRVVDDLRSMLHAKDFTTAWAALRIVRVVPVPALVPHVCALLDATLDNSPITYDALYALSSPVMAAGAASVLTSAVGIPGIVSRTIAEVRIASRKTIADFARLLAAFDPVEMDTALASASRDRETGDTARALRGALTRYRTEEKVRALFVAGYNSDTIDVNEEFLGIDEDVQTLTAVMLAAEVKPPLAIGLFGDWGSGKSYFMKSMNVAAQRLADRAKRTSSPQFCHDIVQIEFNAWHYADTNLWANLVSTILERLASHVTPRETPEEEQAALLKELGTAKISIEEANAVKSQTETAIEGHQTELVKLQRQRQDSEFELRDLRFSDFKKLLAANTHVKEQLDGALHDAGVPPLVNSANDLSRAVAEAYSLRGRATALFVALTTRKNAALFIVLLAALVLIPIGLPYLLAQFNGLIPGIATTLSEAVVALGGLAAFIGSASRHVAAVLKRIDEAKASVDDLVAEKRKKQDPAETGLQAEILKLKAQEKEASARVVAASARATELEERIRAMKEARTLARFLDERTSSDDYRKYLGLVSTVRRDFEALGARLKKARSDGTGVNTVDRIVLYIDDLDRCPAQKVMEVLQAVHLLLAYDLFVVVVGVDPRWLIHSLESTYTAFESDEDSKTAATELWATTPRDYLEKIFQIPFNVLPMSESGYGKLMSRLLGSKGAAAAPSPDAADDAEGALHAPAPGLGAPAPAGGSTGAPDTAAANPADAPDDAPPHDAEGHGESTERVGAQRDFVVNEDAMTIQPWEESFAQRLFPFIPTPRAAKRFSNVYRILKAPVRREDLPNFEGTAEVPGEFRVAMLALAIVIGAPDDATILLPKLYQIALDGKDITEALRHVARIAFESPRCAELQKKLDTVVDDELGSARAFAKWLPRVSRFSFDTGRALAHGDMQSAFVTAADQFPEKSST
jgi:hypothetical protein